MCSSSVSLGRNLVSLKWEDFNNFVVSELAALYQKDDLTDVVLWCDGRSFRAHKVLLSLWSSYFREVFRSTTHAHPVVILRETNSIDLELILRFIYQGHLLIPIEDTDRFLKTAEHLQVAGLKNMRNHIPNFNYSATGAGNNGAAAGGTPSYHEENGSVTKVVESTLPQQQQHQGPHAAVYDGTVTISSSAQGSPQVIYSTSSSSHPLNSGAAAPAPPPPHMSPVATDTHTQYLSPESNGSNQQQVIRQSGSASSSRSTKHTNNAPPPTAYAQTAVAYQSSSPGENLSVSSSSRHSSESVIFQQQPQTQPQPVLIFQNGPVSRSSLGGNGRPDHSAPVVVIEGVVPDSSVVHHDSSSNHGNGAGTNTYTVYTSSAVGGPITNPPHHHATIEGPGNEMESQTQIHREETPIKRDSIGHLGTQQQHTLYHHHQHHQPYQPTESHHAIVEMDTSTTSNYILPHSSYASTTPVSHEAPTQNGGLSPTATFTVTATKSKPMILEPSPPPPPPPPVYAVKRVPPLLPPSPPPPQTPSSSSGTRTSFKNASPTKNATSPTKKGSNFTQHETSCIATRSKSTAGGTKTLSSSTRNSTTSQMALPATRNNSNKDDNKRFTSPNSSGFSNTPTSSSTSTPTVNRKVVLVPCPKCGKKVKQTSLKVHMKRSHLEEGTVLVCPICSKRISSKGVYYKHMYIHRKRSETPGKSPQEPQVAVTSNTHAMKSEPQGT